jgi:pimeloyl-ACP methyl ester carboxylesterase
MKKAVSLPLIFTFLALMFAIHSPAAVTCGSSYASKKQLETLSTELLEKIATIKAGELEVVTAKEHATRFRLQVTPEGKPMKTAKVVLIIHGLYLSPKEMTVFENAAFEAGHNVLNVRLPGHLEKDPKALDNVNYREWVDATVEYYKVAEQLGNEVYTVGHSTGALLLTALAKAEPATITNNFLVAPAMDLYGPVSVAASTLRKLGVPGNLAKRTGLINIEGPVSLHAALQVKELARLIRDRICGGASFCVDSRETATSFYVLDTARDTTISIATNRLVFEEFLANGTDQVSYYVFPKSAGLAHGDFMEPETRSAANSQVMDAFHAWLRQTPKDTGP